MQAADLSLKDLPTGHSWISWSAKIHPASMPLKRSKVLISHVAIGSTAQGSWNKSETTQRLCCSFIASHKLLDASCVNSNFNKAL